MDYRYVPIILFLFLAMAIVYYFFIAGDVPQAPEPPPKQLPGCEEGISSICMVGTCEGTKECVDGEWGTCVLEQVCEPGRIYPCSEYGCSPGYRICDLCGTGYGDCVADEG